MYCTGACSVSTHNIMQVCTCTVHIEGDGICMYITQNNHFCDHMLFTLLTTTVVIAGAHAI